MPVKTPRYLLLFGMARSGTSWIGKIFDSHPTTLYKHEPDRSMPGIPMFPGKERAEELTAPIQNFLALLPKVNRNHVAASLPVFPKMYRSKLGDEVHRASVLACAAG